jgi:hypothetical protein
MHPEDQLVDDSIQYPPTVADLREDAQLAPLFDANEQLSAFIRRVWATTSLAPPEEMAPKQAVVLFALGKAYKTHRAIQILCSEGYGEDAAILQRSLFELAVETRYITRSPLQKRALRWLDYDVVSQYEMARVVRDDPYFATYRANDPDGGKIPATLVAAAHAAQAKYGFWAKVDENGELRAPGSWSDKSPGAMARAVGWASHYNGVYALTSIVAHSSVRASNHYLSLTPDDRPLINLRPSANLVDRVLRSAHVYLSAVMRAWLKELGAPQSLSDEFDQLGRAFVAMIEARIGPDRAASARLAGAIQGDTDQ